jgi:diguanylate cyclase (GGDEF)-like protein
MLSRLILVRADSVVLLVSPDEAFRVSLTGMLNSLGLCVEVPQDGEAAVAKTEAMTTGILLLDARLPGVASGCLLALLDERGIHKKIAIALIAEEVSDEWIARLREGVIDDIVPRDTDASGWNTHLHAMQRGHELSREVEQLREATLVDVRHDRLTGVLNRKTMLTLLFRETDRVQRLHGTMSMILLEIDAMSQWKFELGDAGCDQLRREVATRTGHILRSYDLLGRTGENEFLLALPGCSTINAMMLAERLRMDLFGEPFTVTTPRGEVVQAQLSACLAVTSSRGRSPLVVLREAELTLAQSRLSGHGTLRCASESPLSAESGPIASKLFPQAEFAMR